MICDCPLCVTVFLHSLGHLLISLAYVREYTLRKYFVKGRTVRVALALGYLRNIFTDRLGDVVVI